MPQTYAIYTSEINGNPLLTAAELARMLRVQRKTIDIWRLRGRIQVAGLSDRGEYLFDAIKAAALEASPISRGRRGVRDAV
jgi:hypothetical protein